jgi:hypothetical protein
MGMHMPSTQPVPFYYDVEVEGGPNPSLAYILQDGKLVASLFGLVFEDGAWAEIPAFLTEVSQEPFGAGGTRLHFDGNLLGLPSGYELDLYLAFEAPVDFAQPLPIDRLSLDHCLLSLTTNFTTSSTAVLSVTRNPTPPPVSAADHPLLVKLRGQGGTGNKN